MAASERPLRVRSRLSYSLRTMAMMVLVVGLGFGWLAREFHRIARQRAAIARVQSLGGTVVLDDRGSAKAPAAPWLLRKLIGQDALVYVEGIGLAGINVTDKELVLLKDLTRLHNLSLVNTGVTGGGLKHLAPAKELSSLRLYGFGVTDDTLSGLPALAGLKNVVLDYTQVSDAGFARIVELRNLETLSLNYSAITDAGLIHVAQMKGLRNLSCYPTQVTDIGVLRLTRLTNLRRLMVGPGLSVAGAAELGRALPNCSITAIRADGHRL